MSDIEDRLAEVDRKARAVGKLAVDTIEWQHRAMNDMLELMLVWEEQLPPDFVKGATNILAFSVDEIPNLNREQD